MKRDLSKGMTKEFFQAVLAYWKNPSGFNRERIVSLIAEGHLSRQNMERVQWALDQWRKRLEMTT